MIRNSKYLKPSEKSRLVRDFWNFKCGTSLGAAEEKAEDSETSAGGHRYQRHVSDSLL